MAFSEDWAAKNAEMQLVAAIESEEKTVNDTYIQIGKAYAEKYAADATCEFAAQVATVKEAANKIAIYRAQLRDIKGLVVCEKCGADVENTSAFCITCGAEMPIPEDRIKCNGCGCLVPKDVQFCTCCGKLMIVVQNSGAAEAPVQAAPAASTCPSCGAVVGEGMAFCAACGTRMGTAPQPAQPSGNPCPSCGAIVPEDMAFCTKCGTRMAQPSAPVVPEAPVQAPAEPQAPEAPVAPAPTPAPAPVVVESTPSGNVCPACGAVVEDGMAFCTECGASMKAPAVKTCPNCGNPVDDGLAFCEQCGTKL